MVAFLKGPLDKLHRLAHARSWVTDLDRPCVSDIGAFENYIDYFHHHCHHNTYWRGKIALKFPLDAWIYQEIIHETRPDKIIEIGNSDGGSTLFLANMLDLVGNGGVIGIDMDHSQIDFNHPRITWLTGNAKSKKVISKVESLVTPGERVMIIEDSSHTYDNTLAILQCYCHLVSVGCYFVVEDGIGRYQFISSPKPGAFEAIHEFIRGNRDFEIDKKREKFVLTFNPDGFLRRVK